MLESANEHEVEALEESAGLLIRPLRSDFAESDALSLQPCPHSLPRARLPLLPGSDALGAHDHEGRIIAVGCLDESCQVGARGSQLYDQLLGCYDRPPGDEWLVARC